jgi:NAD(P)H dehydrogenase (quinone)
MRVLTVYAHPNPKSFCHAVLQRFTEGLKDAGHTSEVIDLYATRFNPFFGIKDYVGFVHESMPVEILEQMNLRERILDNCGGPLQRMILSRWLCDKDAVAMAKLIRSQMPRDVIAQQKQVAQAQGLVFIAPVFWCHFPAILKGWFERVFNYGFAFGLTSEGWQGEVKGRVPLLRHERALIITPTLFKEEDYKRAGLEKAMTTIVDDWGLRYPGIKQVKHIYFHAVNDSTSPGYLQRAYDLGKEFAQA